MNKTNKLLICTNKECGKNSCYHLKPHKHDTTACDDVCNLTYAFDKIYKCVVYNEKPVFIRSVKC